MREIQMRIFGNHIICVMVLFVFVCWPESARSSRMEHISQSQSLLPHPKMVYLSRLIFFFSPGTSCYPFPPAEKPLHPIASNPDVQHPCIVIFSPSLRPSPSPSPLAWRVRATLRPSCSSPSKRGLGRGLGGRARGDATAVACVAGVAGRGAAS